jgi:hypothetical protein
MKMIFTKFISLRNSNDSKQHFLYKKAQANVINSKDFQQNFSLQEKSNDSNNIHLFKMIFNKISLLNKYKRFK